MSVPVYLVDAFAAAPFGGNVAAVCLLDGPADPAWMQQVAAELQQPATAFVHPVGSAGPDEATFALRWFVAAAELTLCGHGTLATAHVLWESGRLPEGAPARFETASGALAAQRDGDSIVLDFPADPVRPVEPPADLVAALGVVPRVVARGRLDYLVELSSEEEVRAVKPDLGQLRQVETRGTIVTAPAAAEASTGATASTGAYDIISRFFAPGVGIDEDAVTGSAHCALGPYWSERLGRSTLLAYQASARGGVVRVEVAGPRVHLGGRAVTTLRGTLLAAPPTAVPRSTVPPDAMSNATGGTSPAIVAE